MMSDQGMQKQLVSDFAHFICRLFSLEMPQTKGIGTVRHFSISVSDIEIVPLLCQLSSNNPKDGAQQLLDMTGGKPFINDIEYILTFISARFPDGPPPLLSNVVELVDRLRPPLEDEACHKLVLSHLDLSVENVLSDSGKLCGVIDWEFSAVQSLYLAAQDLIWTRYDGIYDAGRFAPELPQGQSIMLWSITRVMTRVFNRQYEAVSVLLLILHHPLMC